MNTKTKTVQTFVTIKGDEVSVMSWRVNKTFADRFTSQSECWEWTGAKNDQGYGVHYLGRVNGKCTVVYAHRYAYTTAFGPIPEGLVMDHKCGNRGCMNPSHLRAVTYKQNGEHKTRLLSSNTSGFRGVTWYRKTNKWWAHAKSNGVLYTAGYFDNIEDADKAARELRAELFTHDDGVLV